MLKHLPTIHSRAAFLLAAFLVLFAASIRTTRAADTSAPYPLKLVGLYVQTHRQSLDLTQMKPVKGNIRLKDVSAIGDGK